MQPDTAPETEQPDLPAVDLKRFAQSMVLILQQQPRLYRNFGVYWWLVKALLKQFYTRENLYLLGDYVDRAAADRIPAHATVQDAMREAIDTYNLNCQFNHDRQEVMAPDGEIVHMWDEDAGV